MSEYRDEIIVLPKDIVHKIAAGEVIERPASVVKELIENSIDAGATNINISIKDGGKRTIIVSDNGVGIRNKFVELAFKPHTTSKIRDSHDLYNILTLGFRGEALSSISTVSRVEMTTRHITEELGTTIRISGGKVIDIKRVGAPVGTTVKVQDIFFNLPARFKFLKGRSYETSQVSEVVLKLSLSRPDISFRFMAEGALVFSTQGDGNLKNTISTLFGPEIALDTIKITLPEKDSSSIKVYGFIGKPKLRRHTPNFIYCFVNKRPVKSKLVIDALKTAYGNLMPKGYYPFAILFIDLDPRMIDVNIHPTKNEILFKKEEQIKRYIIEIIKNTLLNARLETEISIPQKEKKTVILEESNQMVLNDLCTTDTKPTKTINAVHHHTSTLESFVPITKTHTELKGIGPLRGIKPHESVEEKRIELSPIGQFKNTYIICEGEDGLYIIDQHALHERIMYSVIKKGVVERTKIRKQRLIEPYILLLTPKHYTVVKAKANELFTVGIEFEDMGSGKISITSVPTIMGRIPKKEDIYEIIIESIEDTYHEDYIEHVIRLLACKSAIKANTPLTYEEMESLIEQMNMIADPWACAHGRPTIIKIKLKDIERGFERT